MSVIMHIHKTGERCKRPSIITTPASYIKAGDIIERGGWTLFWVNSRKAYLLVNQRAELDADYFEFHNYNCAAAKLAELGK